MANNSKTKKKKARKPQRLIPIDWDAVDKMLEAGCGGKEVAAYLGVHEDTLTNRCEREKGSLFSAYAAQKRSRGDMLLYTKQMQVALSGDRVMLIWLGKQRLRQQESPVGTTGFDGVLTKNLDFLNDMKKDKNAKIKAEKMLEKKINEQFKELDESTTEQQTDRSLPGE